MAKRKQKLSKEISLSQEELIAVGKQVLQALTPIGPPLALLVELGDSFRRYYEHKHTAQAIAFLSYISQHHSKSIIRIKKALEAGHPDPFVDLFGKTLRAAAQDDEGAKSRYYATFLFRTATVDRSSFKYQLLMEALIALRLHDIQVLKIAQRVSAKQNRFFTNYLSSAHLGGDSTLDSVLAKASSSRLATFDFLQPETSRMSGPDGTVPCYTFRALAAEFLELIGE